MQKKTVHPKHIQLPIENMSSKKKDSPKCKKGQSKLKIVTVKLKKGHTPFQCCQKQNHSPTSKQTPDKDSKLHRDVHEQQYSRDMYHLSQQYIPGLAARPPVRQTELKNIYIYKYRYI
jgi:hypothetical protein